MLISSIIQRDTFAGGRAGDERKNCDAGRLVRGGLSKGRPFTPESAALVELVLKEITDCLERGETVKLSSFGSFVVRKKGQRIGRNPKTGKEVPISPRRVMVFKPSAISSNASIMAPLSQLLKSSSA